MDHKLSSLPHVHKVNGRYSQRPAAREGGHGSERVGVICFSCEHQVGTCPSISNTNPRRMGRWSAAPFMARVDAVAAMVCALGAVCRLRNHPALVAMLSLSILTSSLGLPHKRKHAGTLIRFSVFLLPTTGCSGPGAVLEKSPVSLDRTGELPRKQEDSAPRRPLLHSFCLPCCLLALLLPLGWDTTSQAEHSTSCSW